MKIILLKDIAKIGKKHEVKEVRSGYARNFLIRRGEALFATEEAENRIQKIRETEEKGKTEHNASIEKALAALDGKKITLKARASEKGSLFAGITAEDIQKAIHEKFGISLPEEVLNIPSPFKETGEYTLLLQSKAGKAAVTLVIEAMTSK